MKYAGLILAASLTLATSLHAEEVALHGAVTAVDILITPNKDAIEKATGLTLNVMGNSAGKGLSDLVDGKCDGCLAAGDIKSTVDAAKKNGKEVDPAKLQFTQLLTDEIVFFVNPANPVKKLSTAQVKGILTGKITNWKDVGGNDAPIVVVSEVATGATRGAIKSLALDNEDYVATTKTQPTIKQVASLVAEFKNGIGGASSKIIGANKVQVLETDRKIERPLGIITLGAPSEKVKKVIDAIATEVKGK